MTGIGPAKRPRRKWLLALGIVVLTVFLAVGGLALLALSNPMLLVFLAPFDIENRSGSDVWVTPVGMWEGSGKYGPLPRYRNQFPPAIPTSDNHELFLRAGQSLRFIYDCDDINFRHVLVRTRGGDVFILDTDKMGTRHECYGPQQDRYTVPALASLKRAPEGLLACVQGKSVRYAGTKEYGRRGKE